MIRALFVNTGILGHASVAALFREAAAGDSGIEATHVDLSAALSRRDRVVRRLLCWGPGGAPSLVGSLSLARWRHEMNAGLHAARCVRAAEREAGRPFDVLHFHTQAAAWASLARMRRTPSVVSIDATQRLAAEEAPPGPARWGYRANAAWDARVFRAAAAITVTSRWAADDLVAGQPEVAERVRVMPYPVRLDAFAAAEWAAERFARASRPGGAPVRVLFVGGDFPRKGGWDLLAAWRAGGFEAGGAELVLATGWPLGEAELPPGVRVEAGVRAYTPAWEALWREADVFVMPTRGEAFGMVFQEAAAAGLPVIGTRLNAVPEIVDDGATGLLVPPGDAGALVEALRTLLASAELRRRMGEAGRARMERVADPADYAARLRGLIREVAGKAMARPRPPGG